MKLSKTLIMWMIWLSNLIYSCSPNTKSEIQNTLQNFKKTEKSSDNKSKPIVYDWFKYRKDLALQIHSILAKYPEILDNIPAPDSIILQYSKKWQESVHAMVKQWSHNIYIPVQSDQKTNIEKNYQIDHSKALEITILHELSHLTKNKKAIVEKHIVRSWFEYMLTLSDGIMQLQYLEEWYATYISHKISWNTNYTETYAYILWAAFIKESVDKWLITDDELNKLHDDSDIKWLISKIRPEYKQWDIYNNYYDSVNFARFYLDKAQQYSQKYQWPEDAVWFLNKK